MPGYEPTEVDRRPAELTAAGGASDPGSGDLGAQIAQLLTSARTEADELRSAAAAEVSRATRLLEEASRTADQILDEATRHATARRAEADDAAAAAARAAGTLIADAEARAGHLVADAVSRADRIRSESERELADAIRRRDAIGLQLANVRQMLATLTGAGSAGPADPTPDLELLVSPRPAADTPGGSNRPRSAG